MSKNRVELIQNIENAIVAIKEYDKKIDDIKINLSDISFKNNHFIARVKLSLDKVEKVKFFPNQYVQGENREIGLFDVIDGLKLMLRGKAQEQKEFVVSNIRNQIRELQYVEDFYDANHIALEGKTTKDFLNELSESMNTESVESLNKSLDLDF